MLITHDLGVVAEMADDVLVMYAGRCVEYGTAEDVLARPRMPYTWGLLESIPTVSAASEQLRPIKGLPPSLLALPSGCSFNPRCPYTDRVKGERCTTDLPELLPVDGAGPTRPVVTCTTRPRSTRPRSCRDWLRAEERDERDSAQDARSDGEPAPASRRPRCCRSGT